MVPFELGLDPQRVHAAVVHLPVALALLGIPLVYLTAVSSSDKETLRRLTLAFYALLIPLALLAQWTGEGAHDQVPANMTAEVYDRIEQHEEMAEQVWIFAAVTAVLLAFSTLKLKWFRTAMMSLAMVASLATGGWMAVTGHLGGDLVYTYGVGTPGKALNRPLAAAPMPTPPSTPTPLPVPPTPIETPPAPPVEAIPAPVEVTPTAPVPEPASVETTPVAPPAEAAPAPIDAAPAPVETTPVTPPPVADAPPAEPSLAIRDIVPEAAAKVSYANDVRPIFAEACIDCHDVDGPKGDLSVATVADMLKAGKKSGPGVIPFKPDDSSIVQYIRGIKQPQMPRKRPPLSEDQLHVIRMWIAAGAMDDSAAQPAPSAPEPSSHPSSGTPLEAGKPTEGTLLAMAR
ncbi:MAG: c-type cytochrome domain-containing protein [FCB group bacterium]|jgi:mono/diheme cytochrome c family protein/uncharacterized membrane protein|nr:c-type cytochrome domain-containing protein [FCB group bacterium]